MKRISVVDFIKLTALSFSGIFEVGDSKKITPVSQALAVQREVPLFFTNEGDFSAYPIFSRKLPRITIDETVNTKIHHLNPVIKVGTIRVNGVSSAAILHIGSTDLIRAESKVKHIRKLLDDENNQK
ncbi:spore germination protein GerPE [Fredinandcohnia humi]